MNDQELLELAAKAAGIEIYWHNSKRCYVSDPATPWNPLTDDGDALRLAVKRRLAIEFSSTGVYVGRDPEDLDGDWVFESLKRNTLGQDEYAATRRAITRAAAAEIGKGMK
jgi:hypothetical protein